ncbi:MAG: hypothetical protein IJ140_04785 [Prevotella sp.]|nr:hypothetical protein [Prevotella sp.]
MGNVIEIKNIKQCITGRGLEVVYEISVANNDFSVNYHISGAWGNDRVAEYCDSPVVSFLYDALLNGYDFKSEYPISEKLYYNLTKQFIPHMCAMNNLRQIKINAPVSNCNFAGTWVGTGISCGVDSLATLKEYSAENVADDYKITHLLYFKVGAHHGGHPQPVSEEVENKVFHEELEVVERFCEKGNHKLIVVDSNINVISNKIWGVHDFYEVFDYRNAGVMLMMQKNFCKYYVGTGYSTFSLFDMDICKGLEFNEWWSLPLFSSDSLSVIPANMAMTRLEKTKYISDFEASYDSLMVCWSGRENCCECTKCVRTMVTLDWLGVLDKYSKVFDLGKYYRNKQYYLQSIVDKRNSNAYYYELYEYAKSNNIYLPKPSNFFRSTVYKIKSFCYRMLARLLRH